MLTLHGYLTTCGQRVQHIFLELGLVEGKDFQRVEPSSMAEIKQPAWLDNQPFGQTPYVVDEETGAVIFESRAIARYAALKVGSPLFPSTSNIEAYTKFEIGASVEQSNFDSDVKKMFVKIFGADYAKVPVDSETVEAHEKEVVDKLQGYERILSKQKYLGGNEVTLVDLFHLPFGTYVVSKGYLKPLTDDSLPHVADWWKRITDRPHWKAVEEKRDEFFSFLLGTAGH